MPEHLERALEPLSSPVQPAGDAGFHRDRATIDAALRALRPPIGQGTLALIVARSPLDHSRTTPAQVELSPGQPLPGDRWSPANKHGDQNQLTLMNVDVARVFCNGQPLTLPGDNLLVDLSLSLDDLPPGSLLSLGDAILEITAKEHNGCKQFVQRFGKAAVYACADPEFAPLRLRGVHARVVRAGQVAVGQRVSLLSRGGAR
jgi:hypothetical protein